MWDGYITEGKTISVDITVEVNKRRKMRIKKFGF